MFTSEYLCQPQLGPLQSCKLVHDPTITTLYVYNTLQNMHTTSKPLLEGKTPTNTEKNLHGIVNK